MRGPTKLFVGEIHGNEDETIINFFKSLKHDAFSNTKTIIYNFDKVHIFLP